MSEQRLAEFATFFLEACIDQVRFMETLMQPQRLRERIMTWCKGRMAKGTLTKGADIVIHEALMSGEVEHGALPSLLEVSDRQARKVTAEMLPVGALKSHTQCAPLRLNFPARLASDWMPGLFPERYAAVRTFDRPVHRRRLGTSQLASDVADAAKRETNP